MARKPSLKQYMESPATSTPALPPRTIIDPALEQQLLEELAPRTRYERLMAENIVANEMQALRLRRQREAVLRHYAGDDIAMLLTRVSPKIDPAQIVQLVREWIRGSEKAARTIAEHAIDEERILTDVFIRRIDILSVIDKELAQFERRRARLLEEYRHLKAVRADTAPMIEDAEVME